MGSAPSSVTTHIVSVVKKFNTFEVFPDNCSAADTLIAKEATNALKYVNSNFVSRLGGYMKRKKNDSPDTVMSPNFTNPKQWSRRVAITPNSPTTSSVTPNYI